jgi:hypothetical protein
MALGWVRAGMPITFVLSSETNKTFYSCQESVSPTSLCNAQRCQHKVNGAKDALLFHQHFRRNFPSYFKLHMSTTVWCILSNVVAIKSIKDFMRKSCSTVAPKILVKLTPV